MKPEFESLDQEQNYQAVTYQTPTDTEECSTDIVIIGAGGSGMVAAVRAAECGASVMVLEKNGAPGGNAMMAVGMFALESRDQLAHGEGNYTTVEELFRQTMHTHQWKTDPRVVLRYFRNSGKLMDWLMDKGINLVPTKPPFPTQKASSLYQPPERQAPYRGKDPSHGPGFTGSTVVNLMKQEADRHSALNLLTRTKATALLTDESGAVVGVEAVSGTKQLRIRAKSVIVAAGGVGASTELLERFFPQYFPKDRPADFCRLSLGHSTGDGILMAEQIGALVGENMGILIGGPTHHPWSYAVHVAHCCPENIYVNAEGRRFMSETAGMDGAARLTAQPYGRCWSIMDSDTKELLLEKGQKRQIPIGNAEYIQYFDAQFQEELEEGRAKVARCNTLEEAAAFIGCSPEILVHTVAEYNAGCARGTDTEFYKEAAFLRPIEKAPFYVIRGHRFFDTTHGGITINEDLNALDTQRRPIPNLFVSGDNASGWCGQEYGPPAGSLTWAFNSGYLAGEAAALNAGHRLDCV